MSKTLTRDVYVSDPEGEHGEQWFNAGDTLPNWADGLVTNPKAFAEPPDEDEGIPANAIVFDDIGDNRDGKETVEGLAALSSAELSELLAERDLPTSGNKSEKIARLQEHDASPS